MVFNKRYVWWVLAVALTTVWSKNSFAEKAPLSKRELQDTATHIVVGDVQAIYSRTERKGDYEYLRHVAEVRIDKMEKGEGPGELIYVRFFDIVWKGVGQMPPGPSGHYPRPKRGDTYRFYLSQNAYDGFSRDNNDGGFNVIYGNGVQPLGNRADATD
jgi:hypothetical protein